MNIRIRKAARDLLSEPGRIVLVLLALIIGLTGVGTLLVSYTILSNDLNRNFTGTGPLHAAVTSKDFGRLNIDSLRNRPGIEAAEFRDFATLRIETRPDEWIPLWLFGVDDFGQFHLARIFDQSGSGMPVAPPAGSMLIERDGLRFSDLKQGGLARIRAGGKVVEVPVAGIGFDPAQAPGTQDHLIYGYVDKETFAAITGGPVDQRLILRFAGVHSKKEVKAAADELARHFASLNIRMDTLRIPKFMEHPHQWQLNTLLFMIGSVGSLAFFLGAVMVSQLMAAVMAKQVRQIGILKAVGASRGRIIRIYATMVLVLGALSCLIGAPLAVRTGYAFAHFVATVLNFEVLTASLPHWLYACLAVAGLLLPIVLSFPAILRGTRISVHDALSDYGIQQTAPRSESRTTSRLPVPRSLLLAYRNTLRRKKRLAITVATMALGVAIFNAAFNVQQSMKDLLTDVDKSMKHDVQVVLINQLPKEEMLRHFQGLGNVERIEAWNGGRGAMQNMVMATDSGVGIIALPYDSDLVGFRSIRGRWLGSHVRPEIVLNQEAAAMFDHPAIGSFHTLSVGGKKVRTEIVGIVEEVEKAKIYIDKDVYDAFANPEHRVNSLMFVAKDKSYGSVLTLKKEIEKRIAPTDLQVLYVMMQKERVRIIYDHLKIVFTTLAVVAFLVLLVSAIGMASAMGIAILERTREIGVMRAIGAPPKSIYRLFVAEGMIVSGAGIAFGLLLSWPLSAVASKFFGTLMLDLALRYSFSPVGFVMTLIATFAFGWLASLLPARKAVAVSTREALAYE